METETKVTDEQKEELAYYRVISDAYKQRFRLRYILFHKILAHMLNKMKEEVTVYCLMDEIRQIHKTM